MSAFHLWTRFCYQAIAAHAAFVRRRLFVVEWAVQHYDATVDVWRN